ncbi:MAG: cytochrome bc complex cytochrome b subunit [Candidatus Wallbacteria bacterium]|nr:cytochrome bc complex cytochrome b subunit [Candidatus Wallbacteria bacterium]
MTPVQDARGWLAERVPLNLDQLTHFGNEPVPNHLKRWWFCLGGTPAYLFLVQVVTGILLTFYYVPEPGKAYDSVRYITDEAAYGWFIRGLHKWSANLMIVAVVLHAMRVFFTGAYRKPRELNWVVGSCILGVVLLFGFTGYSLVYEQLSYWGATVAGNITSAVPVMGDFLGAMLRGGERIGDNTLTRFFVLHIGVLPTIITCLLFVHILLIRLIGVTEFHFADEDPEHPQHFPFFPDHLLTEMAIGVVLMIVLTCLVCAFPPGLGERANPLVTPEHIKPEWYFFWAFRWLKLAGLKAAVVTQGLAAVLFAGWPWIDAAIRRRRPDSELSIFVGVVAFLFLLGLTLWEALA